MINIRKLEAELWESADLLRAGSKLTSNQYCMPVLGLIFLRYAYSRFKMVKAEILKNRPSRGGRVMPVEASDFVAKSALFLPKEAQYDYLLNLPDDIKSADLVNKDGQSMSSLGEVVNNAMALIEEQSEQLTGVLPKGYTDFSDELLSELLRIFNNSALDEVGGDIIGRIYEYFLNKFAKNIASDDGVFFTPKSLVKIIVNIIEPKSGILLDPALDKESKDKITESFEQQIHVQSERKTKADYMKYWLEYIADNIQSMHNNDQNQLIQQIYKYLNDNFSQPIGLTNVSEHVNRNPSYISRFIKQATGRKFSEILAELRLEEAKKLLRSSNLKITQIAEQVGYPNLQYFTRVFTGQMNMTPAEYRKITTYF